MKRRSRYPRQQQDRLGHESGEPANREDVAQLLEQLSYPSNRKEIKNFAAFVPVLVREARLFGLPIPPWLAAAAGFPAPLPPLRLVIGGRRDDDGIGSEHPFPPVP